MIRTDRLQGPPTRRIAVIAMPRPQRARLGIIRPGDPAGYGPPLAWTTISDMQPESSMNFISSVIARQALAVQATPGTLTYTPAPAGPAPNVPPWNSWLQPNCAPSAAGSSPVTAALAAAAGNDAFWIGAGLAAAAAGALYLLRKGRT
jgi:hypothetical protein